MAWYVLKTYPLLKYNAEKKTVDLNNSFYHYFCYHEEDINFALVFSNSAVVEQVYFLSSVVAFANSLGGTSRLVKNIFYTQSDFVQYVQMAQEQNISLPYHAIAKARGQSTPGVIITDAVDQITKTVSSVADTTTENLLGFRLSTLVPYLLVLAVGLAGIYVYKNYLKGALR